MTGSKTRASERRAAEGRAAESRAEPVKAGSLLVVGTRSAAAAALLGLATVTIFVVAGWIAAPHVGFGLAGVLRAAAVIWLAGHHVAVQVRGAGGIGMLPVGLAALPGFLLWRAGRAVARRAGVASGAGVAGGAAVVGGAAARRAAGPDQRPVRALRVAFAVAAPYSLQAGLIAAMSRSSFASASVPWAVVAGFVVAFVAAGLGAARALAPWRQLADAIPAPARAVLAGAAGSLAVLAAVGFLATAMALASHVRQFGAAYEVLGPGLVGAGLLLLVQLAYLPNAAVWAICYMLGPGFAVGTRTIVAPTGSVLAGLPAFPLLAAVPDGPQGSGPGWLAGLILAVPYLAGLVGGIIVARTAPTPSLEGAPVRGFAAGAIAAAALAILTVFAGGPLGNGRLSVVGPSPWQTGLVAVLELGISAAVGAGIANWRSARKRRAAVPASASAGRVPRPGLDRDGLDRDGLDRNGLDHDGLDRDDPHVIFMDRWATGEQTSGQDEAPARRAGGPSALPGRGSRSRSVG